jgi:hypothetical protein
MNIAAEGRSAASQHDQQDDAEAGNRRMEETAKAIVYVHSCTQLSINILLQSGESKMIKELPAFRQFQGLYHSARRSSHRQRYRQA